MAEILSLAGREVFSWARAAVMDGLTQLSEHKNVPLDPALREALAKNVLARMDFSSIHRISAHEQESLIAMVQEVDTALNATVLARMWHLIALAEGKSDMNDPAVHATANLIMQKFMDTLPKQGVA